MPLAPSLYSPKDSEREFNSQYGETSDPEPYRSEFRRDYARLIHSAAFRRLQAKTQLFPGWESDFFRNRLTHSLEVSQIAESLAYKINYESKLFQSSPIDPRVTMFAGLAHDLGHPPFGHNGEKALDDLMKQCGGFEGNAQTLRILARVEKKEATSELPVGVSANGRDRRVGLNLCYRSLASILKYDKNIPVGRRKSYGLVKGYYDSEAKLVSRIKGAVAPGYKGKFKTIECAIMDVADDIAYSTYDLEDTLKAGFLSPLDILASSDKLLNRVADAVSRSTPYQTTKKDVLEDLIALLGEAVFPGISEAGTDSGTAENSDDPQYLAIKAFRDSRNVADVGYARTQLTSDLISNFISGVSVVENKKHPSMSSIKLNPTVGRRIEVLKRYTYHATISSPRLRIVEHRGYEIVREIFEGLADDDGHALMPDDFQELYDSFEDENDKRRVICDFVAGMTDRYALEFYARLKGENPQTIFKPY